MSAAHQCRSALWMPKDSRAVVKDHRHERQDGSFNRSTPESAVCTRAVSKSDVRFGSFASNDPNSGLFTSVIVVGHSDRQDDASMSCDQRRTSEIEAATNRANSAWNFVKDKVAERLTQSGISAANWPETAQSVTWAPSCTPPPECCSSILQPKRNDHLTGASCFLSACSIAHNAA
jgi:hypothetical protein